MVGLRTVGLQTFSPQNGQIAPARPPCCPTGSTSCHAIAGFHDPDLQRNPKSVGAGDLDSPELSGANTRASCEDSEDATEGHSCRQDTGRFDGESKRCVQSRIIGRFQRLKGLGHPNIVRYVEIMKVQRNSILIADARHSKMNVSDLVVVALRQCRLGSGPWEAACLGMFLEMTSAIEHLHTEGLVHRCIRPDVVLVGTDGHLSLADCGLFHVTGHGEDVGFAIGSPEYSAPEVILAAALKDKSDRETWTDVWSLGAVLFWMLRGSLPWSRPSGSVQDTVLALLQFCCLLPSQSEGVARCVDTLDFADFFLGGADVEVSLEAARVLHLCLDPDSRRRPTAAAVLSNPYFCHVRTLPESNKQGRSLLLSEILGLKAEPILAQESVCGGADTEQSRPHWVELPRVRVLESGLTSTDLESNCVCGSSLQANPTEAGKTEPGQALADLERVHELLYYWVAAGGDYQAVTSSGAFGRGRSPVFRLPSLRLIGDEPEGCEAASPDVFDDKWSHVDVHDIENMLGRPSDEVNTDETAQDRGFASRKARSASSLSVQFGHLVVDAGGMTASRACAELQLSTALCELARARPPKRDKLLFTARSGIPAMARADVWAAVLEVDTDMMRSAYTPELRAKCSEQVAKQIAKDVPRCHRYNPLLASAQGQTALSNVLRAWAGFNPGKHYWQGVDALAAPLVLHHINDEAVAFGCLHRLVETRLPDLFAVDSLQVAALNGMLGEFQRLLAFLDPELFRHLKDMELTPDLYAIPWFLTWFSHLLPLSSLYHLWDRLLVGSPKLPIFFAVSVVVQIREWLLSEELDGCFSRLTQTASNSLLPSIGALHDCIAAADAMCERTPPSILAGNCVGLHLRETTPAEIIPSLSLQDCIDLLASSSLSIVDTSPADKFRHVPGQNRVSVPGGVLEAHTLLDGLNGLVVAVTGPDEMSGRRLAEQLMMQRLIPCVCLLSWDEIESLSWKTVDADASDEPGTNPEQPAEEHHRQQQPSSQDSAGEGLGSWGASVGLKLRGVGSLAGGGALKWRPQTWLGFKSREQGDGSVQDREGAMESSAVSDVLPANEEDDVEDGLWAAGVGEAQSGRETMSGNTMSAQHQHAADGWRATPQVSGRIPLEFEGLKSASDGEREMGGGGWGWGVAGEVEVVAERKETLSRMSSWDFSDDEGKSDHEGAGGDAQEAAGGQVRRRARKMVSDGNLERAAGADDDELGGWGMTREWRDHASPRKAASESNLEACLQPGAGEGGWVDGGQDRVSALKRGMRMGLAGAGGLRAISGSVLSATKATVDKGASLGKKFLDALPDD